MRILKRHLQKLRFFDWLMLLSTLAFSCWLMMSTFGYKDGQIWLDSKLYSDFGAHLPLIRSFSFGENFPPEYPFYVGEPIRYHYLFYLIVGMLEKLGLRIDWALNIPSILGFWLLLMMIYLIGKKLFISRLAGFLAVMLFLFNGSLSFVEYFNQHGWTFDSLLAIPRAEHFASFGPWSGRPVSAFWNLNIYTNQRHLGLSFGLVLLAVFPLLSVFGRKAEKIKQSTMLTRLKKTIGEYLLGLRSWLKFGRKTRQNQIIHQSLNLGLIVIFALMPILHQAGYVILLYLAFGLIVLSSKNLRKWGKIYLAAGLLSLVSFWYLSTGSSQPIAWQFGYLANDKSVLGLLEYWWYNLGVYLPFLPVLLIFSWRKKNPLLGLATGLFVVANLVRLSPDMINNHKLLNFFMMVVNVFTAGFLVDWLKRTWFHWVVAILLIPAFTFSGVVDLFPIINDYSGGVDDWRGSEIQTWIKNHTPPRAQFLTASYMYSPASLAGRPIYLDYGYHAWSMGYSDQHKRRLLPELWSADISLTNWCQLMRSQGLAYVLVGPGETVVEGGINSIDQSRLVREIRPHYQSQGGWRVWQVQAVCDNGGWSR